MEDCPKCLGIKEVFNPSEDKVIICDYCEGEGKVSDEKYTHYDPFQYDFMDDEEI